MGNDIGIIFTRNSTYKNMLKLGMTPAELDDISTVKKYLSDEDIVDYIAFNALILSSLKIQHLDDPQNYYETQDSYAGIYPALTLLLPSRLDAIKKKMSEQDNNIDEPLFTIENVNGSLFHITVSDVFYKYISGKGKLDFLIDLLTVVNKFVPDTKLFKTSLFAYYQYWLTLKIVRS
jgi:hypothetical protein